MRVIWEIRCDKGEIEGQKVVRLATFARRTKRYLLRLRSGVTRVHGGDVVIPRHRQGAILDVAVRGSLKLRQLHLRGDRIRSSLSLSLSPTIAMIAIRSSVHSRATSSLASLEGTLELSAFERRYSRERSRRTSVDSVALRNSLTWSNCTVRSRSSTWPWRKTTCLLKSASSSAILLPPLPGDVLTSVVSALSFRLQKRPFCDFAKTHMAVFLFFIADAQSSETKDISRCIFQLLLRKCISFWIGGKKRIPTFIELSNGLRVSA